jgi:hypothetical protein
MKPASVLKSPAARSVVFASFMIFGMINVSHAQTPSTPEQSPTAWGDTAAGQLSWSSAQQPGSCGYTTPDQESFLCKMIRIFYGPDTPPGPNRDMDNNISAGGAGG